jgi:hypothetical protein
MQLVEHNGRFKGHMYITVVMDDGAVLGFISSDPERSGKCGGMFSFSSFQMPFCALSLAINSALDTSS